MNRPRNTPTSLKSPPSVGGPVLDAQLHLLDRQVIDVDGLPVTTVDDIELEGVEADLPISLGARAPVISALLTGPVLGTRLVGGRPPSSRLIRLPWHDVSAVDVTVRLGVRSESLSASWVERWVRDKIIRRIPGGKHDPD